MERESDGARKSESDAREAQDAASTGRETPEELASVDDTGLEGLRRPAAVNSSDADSYSFSSRESDARSKDDYRKNSFSDSGAESRRSDSLKTHVKSPYASRREPNSRNTVTDLYP